MYLNNLSGAPIKEISFEGYMFTVPVGVSLAWEKFGRFIVDLYKVKGEGGGVPPVVEATASQWKGDRYVDVRRFELNAVHIPNRKDLLKIGKQRGVDAETLEQWREDETIPNTDIAKAINDLEVPDQIKYPAPADEESKDTTVVDAAEAALKDGEDVKTPAADTATGPAAPVAPAAPQAPAAPANKAPKTKGSGAKGGKAKQVKAAAKAPKTPKSSKK